MTAHDALRRKLRTDGGAQSTHVLTPASALRSCVARAALNVMGAAVTIVSVRQSRVDGSTVSDALLETGVLMLLSAPGGRFGAFCCDPSLVIAAVDCQTMGRARAIPEEMRRLTPTDAALVQPVLEQTMSLFTVAMEGAPTASWTQGFSCVGAVPSKHVLALNLDDMGDFRSFDLILDIENGVAQGRAILVLPMHIPQLADPTPKSPKSRKARLDEGVASHSSRNTALSAQARLTATLPTFELTLAQISELSVGDVFPIGRTAIEQLRLRDPLGAVIAHGRLGQLNGQRAIKLRSGGGYELPAAEVEPETEVPEAAPPAQSIEGPENAMKQKQPDAELPDPAAAEDELDALLSDI